MNRDTLIREVAERTDEPLGIVEQIIGETLDLIAERLVQGEPVNLHGLGNFFLRPAAPRQGENRFGEPIEHPPYVQVCFRADRVVKRLANGGRGASGAQP